ncbi:hypothetical protein QUW13_11120 [Enterococcus hirae]|jgi:hypothetical protein|nr:hypothetical protein [Enterococcaceae bacterium]MDM8214408.1 hypothetical protein [Enterococcus hirae]
MVGFNNSFAKKPEPVEIGVDFKPQTRVTFVINGKEQTGKVEKQLTHAAVVAVDETDENNHLMFQTNGVVVVNYRKLTKMS